MEKELHILILEDAPTDAELAERELRKANVRFCSKRVETRESFLKELKDFGPDLILADYRLPSFDGLSALALAQERCPDVPFIFVSGALGEELAIETLKSGATDYVLKERLSRLAPSVRRALREAQERTARERAEEALRESEDRYRDLVEKSEDLICTHDLKGNLLSVNQALIRRLGFERAEELLGRKISDLLAPDVRHLFNAYLGTVVREGHAEGFMKVVTRSGEERILEYHNSLRTEGLAKPIVRGRSHDVTERKLAERALSASEKQFRTLTALSPVGIFQTDANGKFLYVNEHWCEIVGLSLEEAAGDGWVKGLHPDDRERIASAWCQTTDGSRGEFALEYRFETPAGRVAWVSGKAVALRDDSGKVTGYMGTISDITERKRAEETMLALYRASLQVQEPLGLQERLDRLLQTARDILGLDRLSIFLADSAGQWLQVIATTKPEEGHQALAIPIGPEGGGLAQAYRARQMVVWDGQSQVPEALRLQPPYDRIKSPRSGVFAIVPLVVQGRAIGVLGADLKHSARPNDAPTVEVLQLFATQAGLAIEQARLYESQRMAAIRLEATVEARTLELQAANVRLEAASHHKSEFLANMSHELRTPLNSVLGFSQLLAQQGCGPLTEKQARYVDNIHKSGQHLLALISDLLDLSKVEAGKLELRPAAFDLCEAVETALHDLHLQGDAKGVALEFRVVTALPPLTADPIRVKQILHNLLSNAVKFTPTGGRIAVTIRQVHGSEVAVERAAEPDRGQPTVDRGHSGEFVEIAVQDTGIGIMPHDLPRLFQPFTQLEPVLTKPYGGTGLGLALTKRLVELHGGTIWAESAGEGKGSMFTVRLPLVQSRGAPRLLVVDDDETLVAALQDALEIAGYHVETAGNGEAALTQMESSLPDLLILDFSLPKVDGWEVLRRLRSDTRTLALPILVITGVEVERGDEALTAGANEFLTKPFSMTVLESTVRRLLGHR